MAPSPLGKVYISKLRQLEITVELRGKRWSFWIQQDGNEVARHVPCWLWNQTDQSAKMEAVEKALELLGWQADPRTILKALNWTPCGSGDDEGAAL